MTVKPEDVEMTVKIVSFKPTKVAALEHRGSPVLLEASVEKFIEWRKSNDLSPVETSTTYGIAYDNPETTPPDAFRFDICGEVNEDVPANPQGVITKIIPGGRCAVMRHFGSVHQIGETVRPLYAEWLPKSGEQLRDFPCLFHYVNPNAQDNELMTDVYLPIK